MKEEKIVGTPGEVPQEEVKIEKPEEAPKKVVPFTWERTHLLKPKKLFEGIQSQNIE